MAQQNDPNSSPAAPAPDGLPADRPADDVAIFSAPALGVVFHWWVESNRRWTERNRTQPLMLRPLESHGGTQAVPFNPD